MQRSRWLPSAAVAALVLALLAAPFLPGCASGKKKSAFGEAGKILRDQRITRARLE